MMLSTFLSGGLSAEGYVTEATKDLEAQMKTQLEKLSKLSSENEESARRLATLPPGGIEALKREVEKLREELRKQLTDLGTAAEEDTRSNQEQAARDASHGIAATAKEVEAMRKTVGDLAEKADTLQRTAAELDKKVRAADARLLTALSARSSIWLVPDTSTTTKEPLLIVVTGDGLTLERFNKPASRAEIRSKSEGQILTEFRMHLDRMDRLNDYIVFYIKPSGVALFDSLQEVARTARFEIGYDALEENKTIIFSPPPDQTQETP
ncbi:MAG: hypothetical protein ACAI35_19625 [Candidatus Methylacidiphilales bacterium]